MTSKWILRLRASLLATWAAVFLTPVIIAQTSNPPNAVYQWSGGSSNTNAQPPSTPANRRNAGFVRIGPNQSLLLFGLGSNGNDQYMYNDMWMYNDDSNSWSWWDGINETSLTTYNTIPGSRYDFALTFVPPNKLLLFGGMCLPFGQTTNGPCDDLWVYNIGTKTWSFLGGSNLTTAPFSSTMPQARYGTDFIKDPTNPNFFYIFGGLRPSNIYRNDLWRYDVMNNKWQFMSGSNATNAFGTTSPFVTLGARSGHVFLFDPTNPDRLLVFGGRGYTFSGSLGFLQDLWALDVPTMKWKFLSGSNMTNSALTGMPAARQYAEGFVDAASNKAIIIFAGLASPNLLADVWRFHIPSGQWSLVGGQTLLNAYSTGTLPGARYGMRAVYRPSSRRALIFGGYGYGISGPAGFLSDAWSLELQCFPGTYYDTSSGTCTMCSTDTFMPTSHSFLFNCNPCPPNATTNGMTGMSNCGCPAAYSSSDPNINPCEPCPVNMSRSYWTSGPSTCTSCPTTASTNGLQGGRCGCAPGTYTNGDPLYSDCVPCPIDTFTTSFNTATSQSCITCPTSETTGNSTGKSACVCRVGYFRNTTTGVCQPVPANTYKDVIGDNYNVSTLFVPCAANATTNGIVGSSYQGGCGCPAGLQSSNAATTPCQQCPADTYSNSWSNFSACTPCPLNTVTNNQTGQTLCGCVPGTFSSYPMITSCTACAVDTFQPNFTMFASSCSPCPQNETTNGLQGQRVCVCRPGFFRSNTTGTCTPVPINTYKPIAGDMYNATHVSIPCATGATTNGTVGGDSVMACGCPPGSFSSSPDSTPCSPCFANRYSDTWSRNPFCIPCPTGTSTFGQEGQTRCGCPPGTASASPMTTACAVCGVDTYQPIYSANSTICIPCATNETTDMLTGQSKCVCRPGYYRNISTAPCDFVPPNFYKDIAGDKYNASTPYLACPENATTNDIPGSTTSLACGCPTGFFAFRSPSNTSCRPCDAGTFRLGWTTTFPSFCDYCAENATSASGVCVCPPNFISSSDPTYTPCSPCPPNTDREGFGIFAAIGLMTCTPCPANASTRGLSGAECVCIPGHRRDFTGSCVPVPPNTYKPNFGNLPNYTIPCGSNATTNGVIGASNASACGCPSGWFPLNDPSQGCAQCPPDFYRDSGWFSVTTSARCTRCRQNAGTNGTIGSTSATNCACNPGFYFVNITGNGTGSDPGGNNSGVCVPAPPNTYKMGWGDAFNYTKCPPNATTFMGSFSRESPLDCGCDSGWFATDGPFGVALNESLANGTGSGLSLNDTTMNAPGCARCPIDTYRQGWKNGPSTCNLCPANSGTNGTTGAESVEECLCRPGFILGTMETCVPSPPDTYKSWYGNDNEAEPCPAYSTTLNMTSASSIFACTLCRPGYQRNANYANPGDTYCMPCPPNTYKPGYNGSCVSCGVGGSTGGLEARTSCVCDVGFAGSWSNGSCSPCPAGTDKRILGDGQSCSVCQVNFYKPILSSAICAPCPPNFVTNSAQGSLSCVCDRGFQLTESGTICSACPSGWGKADVGNQSCIFGASSGAGNIGEDPSASKNVLGQTTTVAALSFASFIGFMGLVTAGGRVYFVRRRRFVEMKLAEEKNLAMFVKMQKDAADMAAKEEAARLKAEEERLEREIEEKERQEKEEKRRKKLEKKRRREERRRKRKERNMKKKHFQDDSSSSSSESETESEGDDAQDSSAESTSEGDNGDDDARRAQEKEKRRFRKEKRRQRREARLERKKLAESKQNNQDDGGAPALHEILSDETKTVTSSAKPDAYAELTSNNANGSQNGTADRSRTSSSAYAAPDVALLPVAGREPSPSPTVSAGTTPAVTTKRTSTVSVNTTSGLFTAHMQAPTSLFTTTQPVHVPHRPSVAASVKSNMPPPPPSHLHGNARMSIAGVNNPSYMAPGHVGGVTVSGRHRLSAVSSVGAAGQNGNTTATSLTRPFSVFDGSKQPVAHSLPASSVSVMGIAGHSNMSHSMSTASPAMVTELADETSVSREEEL